jgi:hypothetical protein
MWCSISYCFTLSIVFQTMYWIEETCFKRQEGQVWPFWPHRRRLRRKLPTTLPFQHQNTRILVYSSNLATAPQSGRTFFPTLTPPFFNRAIYRYKLGRNAWALEQLLTFVNVTATIRTNVTLLESGGLWVHSPQWPLVNSVSYWMISDTLSSMSCFLAMHWSTRRRWSHFATSIRMQPYGFHQDNMVHLVLVEDPLH